MIRHAWSVLCEKSSIDRDTNNVTLNVIEKIEIAFHSNDPTKMETDDIKEPHVLPLNLEVVSLWFQVAPTQQLSAKAKVELEAPSSEVVGRHEMALEMPAHNLRTRMRIGGLVSKGAGTYLFNVYLDEDGGNWQRVATIPLELAYRRGPPPTQR